uniref:oligosaccharide flippase family protein n=2 Tax=Flavobacterium sp. TaxID=239 RepID=UPI0040495B07
MSQNPYSYQRILKSTSIFGMVKLSTLLISLVKSKFLAILIGPKGYGIIGLINTTLDLVQQGFGLGIETSGIKNIANLAESDNHKTRDYEVNLLLKLGIVLGLAGCIFTIIFSKQLSIWTFGDAAYQWAFVFSAIALIFRKISTVQGAIFQGLNHLKLLAKANLYSNLLGFILVLPLFFMFKLEAIVPSIVVSAVVGWLVFSFYFKKIKIKFTNIPVFETFRNSKTTLKFGVLLSITSFLGLLSNFLIQIYISSTSTLAQVGLFNIGLVVVNNYIGLVFNAMATDYFPQLTKVIDNPKESGAYITKQAVFSLLVITPIIVFFVALAPVLIPLLFASNFKDVIPMVIVLVLAMFFKAVSWSFGYLIIAKADSKIFMKTSVIFNAIFIFLCCFGFKNCGLVGIGYAYILYFLLHLVTIKLIVHFRYQVRVENHLYAVFSVNLLFCLAIFMTTQFEFSIYQLLAQIFIVSISIVYSLFQINKKTNLLLKISSYFKKSKK